MEHRLENARPKLLEIAEGTWRLTMEELVPVAGSIFRPTEYLIQGSDAVLVAINTAGVVESLVGQTRELMEKYPESSGTSVQFRMRNESWVQVPGSLIVGNESEDEAEALASIAGPSGEKRIRALEKAVKKLGDLFRAMDARLKKLERDDS